MLFIYKFPHLLTMLFTYKQNKSTDTLGLFDIHFQALQDHSTFGINFRVIREHRTFDIHFEAILEH